ncbi:hypothetical protein M407DRAFT_72407, partial [Tulasnella calospora MUT 4182]
MKRRRLLNCLGDGSYGARGSSIGDNFCLPGTRTEILAQINDWVRDKSAATGPVLWISGKPGRGKSAIASTVAHYWSSKGSCAIFHFRRDQHALNGQFICSLARQLGQGLVPEVKKAILDCVEENEDIAKERLEQQFKILFVGSLGTLHDSAHPILIIVDALEECNNIDDAVRFARLIDQHSPFLPSNVKFLLTCRPGSKVSVGQRHVKDLDSILHPSKDIALFFQHSFARIRNGVKPPLPKSWPSSADLEAMIERSQGLFHWAYIAIAY